MKKKEYIEKYGEEAYKQFLEKCRAYDAAHKKERKAYREAHREEKKAYNKEYHEAHREEAKAYKKEYYETHKEERKAYNKEYYEAHKEELKDYMKGFNKDYYSTMQGRAVYLLSGYRRLDREADRGDCTLTADWIIDNIFTSACTYCGETDWTKLGTDRIDNTKPHTPDNCICACGKCNIERQDRYSVEEFSILKRETLKGQASGSML